MSITFELFVYQTIMMLLMTAWIVWVATRYEIDHNQKTQVFFFLDIFTYTIMKGGDYIDNTVSINDTCTGLNKDWYEHRRYSSTNINI